MRPRHLAAAAAATAAAALTVLATGRSDERERPRPTPRPEVFSPPRVPPVPVDSDLEAIRDIFHFGGGAGPAGSPATALAGDRPTAVTSAPLTASPGARLVGFVRRTDRLLAALVLEGEVVLLGPDDSAFGHTAVEVSEERVILRGPTGDEETLLLDSPPQPLGPR